VPFKIFQCAGTFSCIIPKGILEVLDEEGPLNGLQVDGNTKWGQDAANLPSTKNWHGRQDVGVIGGIKQESP
jgi:hypothetical protein